jgi:hypothetical protein
MALWWLSFCDASLPAGTQFLGACIVEGGTSGDLKADLAVAIQNAWRLECNPGGEIKFQEVAPSIEPHIKPKWRNRLLTRTECEQFDLEISPHGVN